MDTSQYRQEEEDAWRATFGSVKFEHAIVGLPTMLALQAFRSSSFIPKTLQRTERDMVEVVVLSQKFRSDSELIQNFGKKVPQKTCQSIYKNYKNLF